jgi:hypothetical protein
MKHEKLINMIRNYNFQTLYLKRSNSDVCLVDETYFPNGKCRNRFSVRSFVTVIRLIGNSDNWDSDNHHSNVLKAHRSVTLKQVAFDGNECEKKSQVLPELHHFYMCYFPFCIHC